MIGVLPEARHYLRFGEIEAIRELANGSDRFAVLGKREVELGQLLLRVHGGGERLVERERQV